MDGVHHRLDVDGGGDVVDEPDQGADADERQNHRACDPDMWHEGALIDRPDGAQHHQSVGEGAEEDAKRHLVAGIAHEVAQQPGAHLARGEGQGGNRDREDRSGDADARRRHGAQQRARALAAAGVAPRRGRVGRRRGQVVEPGREQRQPDAQEHDECGTHPELIAEVLDPGAKAGVHGDNSPDGFAPIWALSLSPPTARPTRRSGIPTMS